MGIPQYERTSLYPANDSKRQQEHEQQTIKPACSRFWKTLAIAVAILLSFKLLLNFTLKSYIHHDHRHHEDAENGDPVEDYGEVVQCADGLLSATSATDFFGVGMQSEEGPPNHAQTSFKLPSDAEVLNILSRGSRMHGNVHVRVAGEDADPSFIGVEIGVWYWRDQDLDRMSICQLHKSDKAGEHHGVGIFNRNFHPRWSRMDELYFEVNVSLPSQHFNSLAMGFSNFAVDLEELGQNVTFDHIGVRTSNGPIKVNNLTSARAALVTTNDEITGSFNTSSGLDLITVNAKIWVDVTLNSNSSLVPTKLLLRTTNGEIQADLSLSGNDSKSAFDVVASTSNKPVQVSFHSQPNSSKLCLDVKTSSHPNFRTRAALHPAFEGTFVLESSNMKPSVITGAPVDPSGQNRDRTVDDKEFIMGIRKGRIWWGDWDRANKGSVNIFTTNSPLELDLSGIGL